MLRLSRTSSLLGILGLIASGTVPVSGQATFSTSDFDAYVREAVEAWEVPGLAVAVVHQDRLLFAEGYGVLELGSPGAVDAHTRFAVGSTTKAMTAAAVGILVDEGRLGWSDPVIEHLPWFRVGDAYLTRDIRVVDLLTHNVGLGNADYLWYEQDVDAREVVERLRYLEPAYSPRAGFIYQNIMYAAAGELVEAVSGLPWEDFVRTRLHVPIGMSETLMTLAHTRGSPNVAIPHDRIDGKLEVIQNASVDAVAAAGSVWSSVTDMSKWLRFLLNDGVTASGERILSSETVGKMFTPHAFVGEESFYPTQRLTQPNWMTYGLGWFQSDYEGRKVDFHTGSIDGMVAIAGLLRDEGVGVYVLANRDHAELRHALMYRVFDLFDDEPPRDWSTELLALYGGLEARAREAAAARDARRQEGTSPSLPLSAYVGVYSDPLYGTIRISGEPLRARFGRLEGSVEHWHHDQFRVTWDTRWRGSAPLSFRLGSDGTVEALETQGHRLTRVPDHH